MTERSFTPPASRFDIVRALPVVGYFLLVFGLLVAAFIRITPASVPRAFANPALREAVRLSLLACWYDFDRSYMSASCSGFERDVERCIKHGNFGFMHRCLGPPMKETMFPLEPRLAFDEDIV